MKNKTLLSLVATFAILANASAANIETPTLVISDTPVHSHGKKYEQVKAYVIVSGKIATATLNSNIAVNGVEGFSEGGDLYLAIDHADGHIINYAPSLDLSKVKAKGKLKTNQNHVVQTINFVEVLNSSPNKKIVALVSSTKPAVINSMSISYTCVEDSDCSIVLK